MRILNLQVNLEKVSMLITQATKERQFDLVDQLEVIQNYLASKVFSDKYSREQIKHFEKQVGQLGFRLTDDPEQWYHMGIRSEGNQSTT